MRILYFSLLVIFAIGLFTVPQAFADATVTNAAGSSTPGCEETADGCFIPSIVTIGVGETVTWENDDTAAHTATSGTATDGPSGYWDSGLVMAGDSYTKSFEGFDPGTYPYHCMVHPWMLGTIIIEVPQAELTMNSPNISEFDNFGGWAEPKVKYNPTGSFDFDDFGDAQSCLSVQVLKPDGTQAIIDYDTACVQHHEYNYNFQGYISDAFNASGWTMKICSIGYNICVEQNFTINFAFLDADTTPPVVEVPPNYTINAVTGSQPTIWGHAVILNWDENSQLLQFLSSPSTYAPFYPSDNVGVVTSGCTAPEIVGGMAPVEQAAQIGFPIGTTTILCTATDAAGNVGSASFTITVIAAADTTPPVLTVPASWTNSTSTAGLMSVPGGFGMIQSWSVLIDGLRFHLGSYDEIFTGTSDCEVFPPSAPPVMAQQVQNDGTDWYPGGNNYPYWSHGFLIGTSTVTCTATDEAGNTATESFTVTIHETGDTTPPVVTVPADMTITSTNGSNAQVSFSTIASDELLDGDSVYIFQIDGCGFASDSDEFTPADTDGSWTEFIIDLSIGTHTIYCDATDAAGNVGSASFTITVVLEEDEPEQLTWTVTNAPGSSTPGCEETSTGCFIPSTVTISVGDTVNWENSDTAAHTATSGTATDGPSGHWDSSFIGSGFSHTFEEEGTYHYFCMVHPWMAGTVVVGDGTPLRTVDPNAIDPTINVNTDKTSYVQGETVTVSGTSNYEQIDGHAPPGIHVFDPDGNIIGLSTLSPNTVGFFIHYLAISESAIDGTYTVKINHGPAMGETTFTVIEEQQQVCGVGTHPVGTLCVPNESGVVYNAPGSSTPGCEETNSCFIPSTITVSSGQGITWYNDDTAAHTATSGSASGGPDGIFDSSLIMAGGSYNHVFYSVGTYDYFCMVHPWMQGTVVVEGASQQTEIEVESEQIEFEPPPEVVETEAEVVTESDEITTGSEITIETDIVNQQNDSQTFAYIVQIKDESGVVLSVSIITGSLGQGQTLTQAISWTPSNPGLYVAEIYLWDDMDVGNPLSGIETQYFTVT